MPEAERKDFREMLGVRAPVLDIMVRALYGALGLVSFLRSHRRIDGNARAGSAMPRGHAAPRVEFRYLRDLALRHLPHNIAHLRVDVVAAGSRGESLELVL